jgi:hypothetical protein
VKATAAAPTGEASADPAGGSAPDAAPKRRVTRKKADPA